MTQQRVSAWLDFDGQVKGEATDSRHMDWIDVLSFSVDAARSVVLGGGGETSKPPVSEITLVKNVDQATPALFDAVTRGSQPYKKVTLDLNMDRSPMVRLELADVLLSGQSLAAGMGDATPTESISLNFTKITFTYILPDSGSVSAGYDLTARKAGALESFGEVIADNDGDGMPDDWEARFGLSIGSNDADGDLDGDGLTNLQEFQLGTNPVSGTSFFRATLTPAPEAPGSCHLIWNSVAGTNYVIEWSPDLMTPFTALRTITATGETTTETVGKTGNMGFYRVRPE